MDQAIGSDERVPITFSASFDASTRGSIIGSDEFKSFTLYAYEEGSESAFINGATFTLSNGVWSSTDSYFWPTDTTTQIEFYAYTPAEANATNGILFDKGVITYDMSGVENKNLPDITTACTTQTSGSVKLNFSRNVAMLQFKVSGSDTENVVKSVSVSNIVDAGELNIADGHWTASGSYSSESYAAGIDNIAPDGSADVQVTNSTGYIMVIPQKATEQVKVTVEIENKATKEFTLSEVDWSAGYIYTYTFNSDTFELSATDIELRQVYNYGEDDESESADDADGTITISVGESITLRAVLLPEGAASQNVYWTFTQSLGTFITFVENEDGTCTITGAEVGSAACQVGLSLFGSNDSCKIVVEAAEEVSPWNCIEIDLTDNTGVDDDVVAALEAGYNCLKFTGTYSNTYFPFAGSSNTYHVNYADYADNGPLRISFEDVTNITQFNTGKFDIPQLQEFVFPSTNNGSITTLVTSCFQDCTMLKTLSNTDCVTVFNNYTFAGCTALETVTFDEVDNITISTTATPDYVFEGCTSLKEVSLAKMTAIDIGMFKNCSSLESINIPAATSIERQAFYGCSSLRELELPNVSLFSYYAVSSVSSSEKARQFSGCTSLKVLKLTTTETIKYKSNSIGSTAMASVSCVFEDFDTESCTLYLHNNNKSTATASTKSWGGYVWEAIYFVDSNDNVVASYL